MATYSEQQKLQARQTDMIDFLNKYEGFHFDKKGNEYRCKEHNSLVIMKDRMGWFWNSQHIGGSNAVDYCMKIHNKQFFEAMQDIVGDGDVFQHVTVAPSQPQVEQPKELVLPQRAEQNNRAIAYLCQTRGIDYCVVKQMIDYNKIYQDKNGNVVFVGLDENNSPKFGCVRGTLTDKHYRGDCKGSNKKYAFSMNGSQCNKHKVFIFEAPIDLLSHATLTNKIIKNERAWTVHNRICLSGTSDVALEQYLKSHPDIKEMYLCLDNDEAGQKATTEIINKYVAMGYTVISNPPKHKDYNEDLIAFLNPLPTQLNNKSPCIMHR